MWGGCCHVPLANGKPRTACLGACCPPHRPAPFTDATMSDPSPVHAELQQQHQRDINCLADDNRQTRRRALEKLVKLAGGGQPAETMLSFWEHALRTPVLKLFADPVEKCRELAITLTTDVLSAVAASGAQGTLAPLMTQAVSRLVATTADVPESSEELRLLLLQLVDLVLDKCGEGAAGSLHELVQVLTASLADAFPDAKKLSCAMVIKLANALPEAIVPHCAPLAAALQPTLTHQHSRVRAIATEALVAVLVREPSPLVELAPQLALITTDRAASVREQAVHSTAELLARIPQRRVHAARLLPLLLCALSDEVRAPSPTAPFAVARHPRQALHSHSTHHPGLPSRCRPAPRRSASRCSRHTFETGRHLLAPFPRRSRASRRTRRRRYASWATFWQRSRRPTSRWPTPHSLSLIHI
eukprot:7378973-Prymnesium_polylepis.3